MYNHMEHLLKCFNKTTGWNEDNIYSNILATSNALLDFLIPKGGKLEISSHATPNLASSMTLLNYQSVNGSLSYLYLSTILKCANGTKDISLQDAIAGFRIIEPYAATTEGTGVTESFQKASLLYGRMYFPGSALEAMVIKRLLTRYQLLIKCINNPHLVRNGTMIVYLQENAPRFSREYIYSTNEALMGFRCLYNFGSSPRSQQMTALPKFDNSVVSVGAEVWYAAMSMSPGLSTAFRYSTRSTSTGKPLTMTLSCNPILGHVSSTYNVKTSVSSTVCSKYDFNWFSYASNLSLGFELFNFSKIPSQLSSNQFFEGSSIHHEMLAPSSLFGNSPIRSEILNPTSPTNKRFINPIEHSNDHFLISSNILEHVSRTDPAGQEVMSAFQKLVKKSNFSSVIKGSTSISERLLKLLWVGRYKEFLVSAGVKIRLNSKTHSPEFEKFGITFTYAC
ncbi:mitochondrial distribution and morphology protein 10 [Metschnikowia bicuspidata var. bicuspidata NRRL YB-4993]|uniref:Mitochondrial distribution and morphology protein 10 n=1 Tax=Metschnikowia bicuspidata var. bicuspidata NRRL YB-4993 TaxID=869754 RepID=A0A1A0HFX0_9ASCO|nr:mitochondrial distribution and morphology protein 10 [Metschnikowia bicuspidata var. bicuspidata NRRL YB-4993]OBA22880.1 mitochondrial distribution and morphology protein 10 [Metschnikowia bicuspidata var. bicuspidata NRRL YB-4993]